MPWKKAWPTELKQKLKNLGIKDNDIAVLEQYGSIEELRKDPKKALKDAKAEAVINALKEAGVYS